jgi:hypothetical protein
MIIVRPKRTYKKEEEEFSIAAFVSGTATPGLVQNLIDKSHCKRSQQLHI